MIRWIPKESSAPAEIASKGTSREHAQGYEDSVRRARASEPRPRSPRSRPRSPSSERNGKLEGKVGAPGAEQLFRQCEARPKQ